MNYRAVAVFLKDRDNGERPTVLIGGGLGESDGVVIVDGSGFPKQGTDSVGVARQYCGHLGKVANCQEGVFLAYASRRGFTFLDERLYLPERWIGDDHRQRWQRCGIPDDVVFRAEPSFHFVAFPRGQDCAAAGAR